MLEKGILCVVAFATGLIVPYVIKVIKWFVSSHTKWGKEKIKQANKKSFSDLVEELRRAFK